MRLCINTGKTQRHTHACVGTECAHIRLRTVYVHLPRARLCVCRKKHTCAHRTCALAGAPHVCAHCEEHIRADARTACAPDTSFPSCPEHTCVCTEQPVCLRGGGSACACPCSPPPGVHLCDVTPCGGTCTVCVCWVMRVSARSMRVRSHRTPPYPTHPSAFTGCPNPH